MSMSQQQDLKQYSKHTNEVLAWLETINKTNKSSPRQPLEQQLQTLSLSYKNAQEKLLSLQKQVYYESLLNEKQRSIIQILKYIINGSLDDDTILTYLVEMQDQSTHEIDSKYEIKAELEEIKQIVLRRKTQDKKADSLKNVALNDLKKELNKCNQVKRQLLQDFDRVLNEKSSLEALVQDLQSQVKIYSEQKAGLSIQIQNYKQNQIKLTEENKSLKIQITTKCSEITQKEEIISKIKGEIGGITKNSEENIESEKDIFRGLKKLNDKMEKYRHAVKQMNDKLKKQALSNELLGMMRIFLPEEALKIYDEFEKSGQKCLIKQMQALAQLQRKKYRQLESCQQQVWRLKQKLLREGNWKNSKTTSISNNKQNINQNINTSQKISQFESEQCSPTQL